MTLEEAARYVVASQDCGTRREQIVAMNELRSALGLPTTGLVCLLPIRDLLEHLGFHSLEPLGRSYRGRVPRHSFR